MKITEDQKKEHPEVEEMLTDLKKITSIESVSKTEGGKLLVESLITDIVGCVDTLAVKYPTLSQQDFVAICADMKSKIDLMRVLTRSRKNVDSLKGMIEETLKQ